MILFVYGMVGWILFGDELPDQWGNIGRAMLTLFVMLTLENFPVYMDEAMEVEPWAWIYFVSFILVAAFIVLNVLIGDRPELDGGGAGARAAGAGPPRALRGRRGASPVDPQAHAPSPSGSRSSAARSTSSSWSSRSGRAGDERMRPALGLGRRLSRSRAGAVRGDGLALALHPHAAARPRRPRRAPSSRNVASPMRTPPTGASAWRRAARFTTSPTTPCLRWPRRPADDAGVHLAAVHADAEPRPVGVARTRVALRDSLQDERRARGAERVVRRPPSLLKMTISSSPTIWCTSPPAPP